MVKRLKLPYPGAGIFEILCCEVKKYDRNFAFVGRATIRMPGPTDPWSDSSRAGFPASHAVPLNWRKASCNPTVGAKGTNEEAEEASAVAIPFERGLTLKGKTFPRCVPAGSVVARPVGPA